MELIVEAFSETGPPQYNTWFMLQLFFED